MGKCRNFWVYIITVIHPHSKGKFYWDTIINLLSLMNAIYVPMEVTYSIETNFMEAVNYIMDCIFIMDIIVNFRTIYFDSRTSDPVTNNKLIALNYIKGGRFFVDLVASLPLEVIGDFAGASISKGTLKLIGLIKLTRLLRLGKIVTYMKMKKSFKHGIKIILLAIYLFLIIHFLNCAAFYIFQVNSNWIPPMDMVPQVTIVYEGMDQSYWIMFYYGALFLLSNDPLPQSTSEVIACTCFVFLGSITLGLLIGQFSSIINSITKRQRMESEKIDFIQQMMFTLKIPETIQARILQYYEQQAKSQYILGARRLKVLAPSLLQKISDHQLQKLFSTIEILKSNDDHLASLFSKHTIVQLYLPGDVVLKQGDEGEFFNIIIDGYVSVLREKKDMKISKFHNMVDISLIQQKELSYLQKLKNKFCPSKQDLEILSPYKKQRGELGSKSRRNGMYIHSEEERQNSQYTKLRDLFAGGYFGEISMLTNLKVTATVYSMHYTVCGQIPQKKFDSIIKYAPQLRKRLIKRIAYYQDVLFQRLVKMIKNAFVFKHLGPQTLQKISYLFKQERHLQGKVLIRKRERSDFIFFVLKGEVEVRFPYTAYDIETAEASPNGNKFADVEEQTFSFAKINEGGYFNLSSALLKKFSMFQFVVVSKKAELMVLNAADLVLQSRKSEDLYYALQSHAVLYEVDGQKYDYNRYVNIQEAEDRETQVRQEQNKQKLVKHFLQMQNQGHFRNLQIFKLIDDLFSLRREKYIKHKRQQYLKELRDKMIKNMTWFKTFQVMQKQAHHYNQEFNEETEEQLMKLLDQTQDEEMLLTQFQKQFTKTADNIEKQIDKFIARKCQRLGVPPEKFMQLIQNKEDELGAEYQDAFDEDYIVHSADIKLNERLNTDGTLNHSDQESEFYDMRELIEKEKNKSSISKEKLAQQINNLDMSVLTKKQKSFAFISGDIQQNLRKKITNIKSKYELVAKKSQNTFRL